MLITIFSKLGNLSRSGVRFLEDQGVLTPRHDENGYRVFSGDDFIRLKLFQRCRNLGFSQREALELAATGPLERSRRLCERREELTRAYEETMAALDQEVCRARMAKRPDAPRLAPRPALYALPTCDVVEGAAAGANASRQALERDGVRWWNELPNVAFGLVTRLTPDGHRHMERCALVEASACGEGEGALPSVKLDRTRYLGAATLLPPRKCLRVVMDAAPSDDPADAMRAAHAAAANLGVTITEDEAVSRELFVRIDGPDLRMCSETWFPVVEGA